MHVVKEKEESCENNTTHKRHIKLNNSSASKTHYGKEKYERSAENDIGRS